MTTNVVESHGDGAEPLTRAAWRLPRPGPARRRRGRTAARHWSARAARRNRLCAQSMCLKPRFGLAGKIMLPMYFEKYALEKVPKTRRIFIVLSLGCICSYWACRLRLRRSRSRSCRTSEARHALSCQLRFRNLPLDLTRIGGVRNRSKPGEVACIHSFIHSNSVLANIGMRLQESILVGRRLRSGPVRAGAQVFSMVLRVELSSASISFSKSSSLDDSLSPVRYSRISFFFCSGVPLSSTSSSSSELPQKKKIQVLHQCNLGWNV